MKKYIFIVAGICAVFFFRSDCIDLTIYTNEDILFISELSITSETGQTDTTFTTMQDMALYLEVLTAEHVNMYINELGR